MNRLSIDWYSVAKEYKEGLSTIKLAEKYNCCSASVRKNLINIGCKLKNNREYRTKYGFNHSYFENIDSEHKAYWFGFISADGNIRVRGNQHIIQFTSCDKEVIDSFIKSIGGKNIKVFTETTKRPKASYRVCLTSEKMYNDLYRHGCVPNKSLTLRFPSLKDVPETLMHHYIRGFFDGDGSVYILNRKWIKTPVSNPTVMTNNILGVGINGTKEFLEELCKYMKFTSVKKEKRRPLTNSYYCSTDKKDTVLHIYRYMYKEATVFLSRKKKVFDDYYKKDVQRLQ